MVKISVTSKLDGIKSWSLQAVDTCAGSKDKSGELVPACQGCYARYGNYNYPNVKSIREYNREDYKRGEWVNDMVQALQDSRFFRWFDSGDIVSLELAWKIYDIVRLTPWCQHWLPTRMEKFEKFKRVIDKIRTLPNAAVRFSSDGIDGEYEPGLHGSVIVQSIDDVTPEMKPCLAYEHGGKCSGCRACWDKSIPVIAYIAHGKVPKAKYRKIIMSKA